MKRAREPVDVGLHNEPVSGATNGWYLVHLAIILNDEPIYNFGHLKTGHKDDRSHSGSHNLVWSIPRLVK